MTDLTERQQACLQLTAAGYGNDQVARRLGVSHRTIVSDLRRARDQLGARSTSHACALAVHHGIVTAEHLGVGHDITLTKREPT
jgi:DNA-binding CsgD family transcriptional regulator